jgi:hypothetical protein
MRTGLGFDPHSGWATVVALGGDTARPEIVLRSRLELCAPDLPRQPYHAVQSLALETARATVERVEASAAALADAGVRMVVAGLRAQGHDPVAAGVPAGTQNLPEELGQILASHTRLHTAEGRLYREVLAEAVADAGLEVIRAPARELSAEVRRVLGRDGEALDLALAELGRPLGPPWRRTEKDAALAAWLAFAS